MLNPYQRTKPQLDQTVINRLPEPLKKVFETRLEDFRTRRNDLIQLVSEGEMTLKAARARAQELAGELKLVAESSAKQALASRPTISRHLQQSIANRKKPKSVEAMQQETVALLQGNLVELQINNRKAEFESRTFVRSAANALPAPSMEKLFDFLEDSKNKADHAAVEWSRRQLEQLRAVAPPELTNRIDIACDRPGTINARLVAKYQVALSDRLAENGLVEAFLDQAVAENDANACAAVFELARLRPELLSLPVEEKLASTMERFPDQALQFATRVDRAISQIETESARQFESMSLEYITHQASLEEIQQPTESEIVHRARLAELANRSASEPVGLRIGVQDNDPQMHLI